MARRTLVTFVVVGILIPGPATRGQDKVPSAPGSNTQTGKAEAEGPGWKKKLELSTRELQELRQAQSQTQRKEAHVEPPASEMESLKKQVDLQQKQIDVLLRMTQLLADQANKTAPGGQAIEELQEKVATQETRAEQAARRDKELSQAQDNLVERLDAVTRSGPELPATLREHFLPTRTNQSPLAIYGNVSEEFRDFSGQNSTFRDNSLMLRPYLLLNEDWLMSANVALQVNQVRLFRAQIERYVNDNWTVVIGRFYSPIGFFTERLRLPWVLKTPDPPMMFNQVYPNLLSFDGLQVRGARYLGNSPVKLEYNGFVANGLSVTGSNLSPTNFANLNNFRDEIDDVNGSKAFGGRIGVSIPEHGIIAGVSGMENGRYDQGGHSLNLWDLDLSYHKGNWDFRFELARMNQQTSSVPIHRQGLYAQVAYRQYENPHPILSKMEYVFRFDHVQFNGINVEQTGIGLGGFGNNLDRMPLDRNRYTIGLNYWFYPSLVFRVAGEWYEELGTPSLRDNGFISQIVWGW